MGIFEGAFQNITKISTGYVPKPYAWQYSEKIVKEVTDSLQYYIAIDGPFYGTVTQVSEFVSTFDIWAKVRLVGQTDFHRVVVTKTTGLIVDMPDITYLSVLTTNTYMGYANFYVDFASIQDEIDSYLDNGLQQRVGDTITARSVGPSKILSYTLTYSFFMGNNTFEEV